MRVTAKTTFIHGSTAFKRGDTVEVSESTGGALLKAGLVSEASIAKPVDDKKQETKASAKSPAKTPTKPADTKV